MSHQAGMYKQDPDTDDDDTVNKLCEVESEWYDRGGGVGDVIIFLVGK